MCKVSQLWDYELKFRWKTKKKKWMKIKNRVKVDEWKTKYVTKKKIEIKKCKIWREKNCAKLTNWANNQVEAAIEPHWTC